VTVSLRARLGLWYGGLTGLVVLLIALVSYGVHARSEYADIDETLAEAAQHVASEYLNAPTADVRADVLRTPVAAGVGMRVIGADDQLLDQGSYAALAPNLRLATVLQKTSPPPYDPLAGALPLATRVDAGSGTFALSADGSGQRWRVYALSLGGGQYLIGLASLSQVDASVAAYAHWLPFAVLCGAIIALLAGWLVASRALRPVAAMTATAGRIAQSPRFDERVPLPTSHDELGRLAATFNDMLDGLQESYGKQQRFVADVSHELRAPLTAIQANLELLQRVRDMPEDERAIAIAEASREAQRLARMVADMLLLARADAGVPIRRQRVALNEVLLQSVEELRGVLKGRRLEVAALESAAVDGDPDRLKQLLVILLDNAVKYSPPSGRISVSLRRQGHMALLAVEDSGLGITPEDLPHVFDRFYRADPARARDPGGSGLGLAIARAITTQHGGDIGISSRTAEGTTVTVHLPRAKVAVRRNRPAAAA
jgi:two-component system, OmpR family, sensor kinase